MWAFLFFFFLPLPFALESTTAKYNPLDHSPASRALARGSGPLPRRSGQSRQDVKGTGRAEETKEGACAGGGGTRAERMSCLSLFLFTNLSLLLSLSCFSQKGGCESLAHFFFVEKFSTRCAHSLSLSLSVDRSSGKKRRTHTPPRSATPLLRTLFLSRERPSLSLLSAAMQGEG